MSWHRMKENAPVCKALNDVFAKMDEVGIEIVIGAYGRQQVKFQGNTFEMIDLEASPGDYNSGIFNFPPGLEHKLVYEKPESE